MGARLFLLFVAGGVGTVVRYLVTLGAGKWLGAAFPYGTLAVNVLGCFLIAGIVHASLVRAGFSDELRLYLTTGLMGGLTTYSSFNLETTALMRTGAYGAAAANFGLTVGLCFVAGLLGLVAARAAFGA